MHRVPAARATQRVNAKGGGGEGVVAGEGEQRVRQTVSLTGFMAGMCMCTCVSVCACVSLPK